MQGHPVVLHKLSLSPAGIISSGSASTLLDLGCFPTGPLKCLHIVLPSTLGLGGFISLGILPDMSCLFCIYIVLELRELHHAQGQWKDTCVALREPRSGQAGAKPGLTGLAGSSRICAKSLRCLCTMVPSPCSSSSVVLKQPHWFCLGWVSHSNT